MDAVICWNEWIFHNNIDNNDDDHATNQHYSNNNIIILTSDGYSIFSFFNSIILLSPPYKFVRVSTSIQETNMAQFSVIISPLLYSSHKQSYKAHSLFVPCIMSSSTLLETDRIASEAGGSSASSFLSSLLFRVLYKVGTVGTGLVAIVAGLLYVKQESLLYFPGMFLYLVI